MVKAAMDPLPVSVAEIRFRIIKMQDASFPEIESARPADNRQEGNAVP
jgi:hypothetical protein